MNQTKQTNQADLAINQQISLKTLWIYTGIFIVMMAAIFSAYFLVLDASFIWTIDGLTQHFLIFGDYLEKLRGLFSGDGFPLWDWSISMGADVIQSYGYYVIGDPFIYLGLLFPPSWNEFAFHLLSFVRVWSAGAVFLLFARKMNVSHSAGLIGAILYAFANYGIFNMSRHPFFILAMIWYPLLCLGAEKILRKESSGFFMLAVAVSAFSNFYFFYKLTILIFIYAMVRYFTMKEEHSFKSFFSLFMKSVYAYLVGLMIAAVLFLPMVYGFLHSSRSPGGVEINLWIYPLEYYVALIKHAIAPGSYFWTIGGFSLLSFIALFSLKKDHQTRYVKVVLIILGVLLLFPLLGSLMNGLSGPYNRFSFVFAFYMALAGGYLIDRQTNLVLNARKKVKWFLVTYTVLACFALFSRNHLTFYMLIPLLFGWLMWFALFSNRFKGQQLNIILLGLVFLNMTSNAVFFYYPFGDNMAGQVVELGTAETSYREALGGLEDSTDDSASSAASAASKKINRIGVTSKDNQIKNQFIYLDEMGLNSYLSVSNGALSELAQAIETSSYQIIQPLRGGIDDRSGINRLLGIDTIITETENAAYIPFGYEIVETENGFVRAQTDYAAPLAYLEDSAVTAEVFEQYNALEKEAVLSENAVLDEEVVSNSELEGIEQEPTILKVPYELTISEETPATDISDKQIFSESGEINMTLTIDSPEAVVGSELYVRASGLRYDPLDENPLLRQPTNYHLTAEYGDSRKSIYQSDRYSFSSYFRRETILINLGYVEAATDETVTVNLNRPGLYTIGSIDLFAKPIDEAEIAAEAQKKNENALEISTFGSQTVAGSVTSQGNEILVTTIPYSEGWHAERNGEPVEIVKANLGFIGIPVVEGDNEIQLEYRTPWLIAGAVISAVGLILLAINILTAKRKR